MPNPTIKHDSPWASARNNATRLLVVIVGIWIALTGCVHGIREVLHGATAPNNLVSAEVGALILLPTYLASGIATVVVSAALAAWTIRFVHTKRGPIGFLGICALLLLTGGGIALVPLSLLDWAIATRINKSLNWWRKALAESLRRFLSRLWLPLFVVCMITISIGVAIWLTGFVPGIRDSNAINYVTWLFLAVGILLLLIAAASAFAKDTQRRDTEI